MARNITIGGFGDYVNANMEKLLRTTVLQVDQRVKQDSPVDLGRFRLGWAIGENAAPYQGPPPGDYRGQNAPPLAVNYQLGREKIGNVYSIHNNLPYAEKLETGAPGSGKKTERRYNPTRDVENWATPGGGSSIQTNGPGWVQAIAKDTQGFVARTAEQISRQS
jgi:hypothetical protein